LVPAVGLLDRPIAALRLRVEDTVVQDDAAESGDAATLEFGGPLPEDIALATEALGQAQVAEARITGADDAEFVAAQVDPRLVPEVGAEAIERAGCRQQLEDARGLERRVGLVLKQRGPAVGVERNEADAGVLGLAGEDGLELAGEILRLRGGGRTRAGGLLFAAGIHGRSEGEGHGGNDQQTAQGAAIRHCFDSAAG